MRCYERNQIKDGNLLGFQFFLVALFQMSLFVPFFYLHELELLFIQPQAHRRIPCVHHLQYVFPLNEELSYSKKENFWPLATKIDQTIIKMIFPPHCMTRQYNWDWTRKKDSINETHLQILRDKNQNFNMNMKNNLHATSNSYLNWPSSMTFPPWFFRKGCFCCIIRPRKIQLTSIRNLDIWVGEV